MGSGKMKGWMAALGVAIVAAGCAAPKPSTESAIQGRWRRDGQPYGAVLADPAGTLTAETFELRPGGVLAQLTVSEQSGQAWLLGSGQYVIAGADRMRITGKCWKGWESYACTETYGFKLEGDRLTVSDMTHSQIAETFTRVGPFGDGLPPTLAPPGPSPTPAP